MFLLNADPLGYFAVSPISLLNLILAVICLLPLDRVLPTNANITVTITVVITIS